jgi:ATP-binding cassette subfamily B protein
MAVTMSIGTIAVWAIGSGRITDGRMSFGALIAFISYMNIFYGPLQWFTAILNWLTRTLAGAQRIFQVLDHTSADIDQPGATPLPRTQGGIRLENIRFSYERGKEVIKGVDLDIKPGEMIGLIGKSGSGKSTLINLICRFYEPDSGRVLVDGLDLKTITFESWRRQIGVVMQEPFLFNASIADNIRYSNPDAPFSAVVAAARAAAAHDFIVDKEEGYDTLVGEGGAALSGGEKQRIAIARAILADPPVLILDEATSSVDGETEKAIQSAITTLVKNRTTIAIAHRLATLRNADRLVVLEDGKMVESGTHEELLAKPDGKFAKMVQTQTEINKLRSEQNVWNA